MFPVARISDIGRFIVFFSPVTHISIYQCALLPCIFTFSYKPQLCAKQTANETTLEAL